MRLRLCRMEQGEQPTSLQIAGATKNTYIKCLVREKAKDIS